MPRRPAPAHKKRNIRTTFVSLPSERKSYDLASAIEDVDLSEWIRTVLNQRAAEIISRNDRISSIKKTT